MKLLLSNASKAISNWIEGPILANFLIGGNGFETVIDDEIHLSLVKNAIVKNWDFYIQYHDLNGAFRDILDIGLIDKSNYNVLADIEMQHNTSMQPSNYLIGHCIRDIFTRLRHNIQPVYTFSILSYINRTNPRSTLRSIENTNYFQQLDNHLIIENFLNIQANSEVRIFICGPFYRDSWPNIQTRMQGVAVDELNEEL